MESSSENKDLLNEVLRGRIPVDDPCFLEWLEQSEENRQRYEDEIALMAHEVVLGRELDVEALWTKVDQGIRNREKPKKKYKLRVLRYAAAIVLPLLLVSGYFLGYRIFDNKTVEGIQETRITPGAHVAMLTLSNGEQVDLNERQSSLLEVNGTQIALQEKGKVVYEQQDRQTDKELFNTIQVPVKGEYSVTLSDGTKVWIAAASKLKFPVNFVGDRREVYLEGEAFFDVAPNKEKPFIVICDNFSVKALGTSFNVMNYADEKEAQATLSTGKIEVATGYGKQILVPGQQVSISEKEMAVREVNLLPYVSWMQDRFYFFNEELQVIMRKIARWYGVEVKYSNPEIMTYHFTGNIPKYKEIDKVFELLGLTTEVDFKVEGNTIIVSDR